MSSDRIFPLILAAIVIAAIVKILLLALSSLAKDPKANTILNKDYPQANNEISREDSDDFQVQPFYEQHAIVEPETSPFKKPDLSLSPFESPRREVTPSPPQVKASDQLDKNTSSDLDDDDEYVEFVQKMWGITGISLGRRNFQRILYNGEHTECILCSLVKDDLGRLYINAETNRGRRTYSADSRHHWMYHGYDIDSSAFTAVFKGVDPNIAFARDDAPASVSQALDLKYNRIDDKGAQFVIGYIDGHGRRSFRAIGGVIRLKDMISARCHWRWGERRHFRLDRISSVFDAETGEEISLDVFHQKHPGSQARDKRTSAKNSKAERATIRG